MIKLKSHKIRMLRENFFLANPITKKPRTLNFWRLIRCCCVEHASDTRLFVLFYRSPLPIVLATKLIWCFERKRWIQEKSNPLFRGHRPWFTRRDNSTNNRGLLLLQVFRLRREKTHRVLYRENQCKHWRERWSGNKGDTFLPLVRVSLSRKPPLIEEDIISSRRNAPRLTYLELSHRTTLGLWKRQDYITLENCTKREQMVEEVDKFWGSAGISLQSFHYFVALFLSLLFQTRLLSLPRKFYETWKLSELPFSVRKYTFSAFLFLICVDLTWIWKIFHEKY